MTIDIPEADLARWIEDVLITLMGITNTQGLKVHLSTDAQIKVLGGAITALNNSRTALLPNVDFSGSGDGTMTVPLELMTNLVQTSDDGKTWFVIDLETNQIVDKRWMGPPYANIPVVKFGSVRPDPPRPMARPPLNSGCRE